MHYMKADEVLVTVLFYKDYQYQAEFLQGKHLTDTNLFP